MAQLEDIIESARMEYRGSHDWIRGLYEALKDEDYDLFEGYFCLLLKQIRDYVDFKIGG